MKLGYRCVEAMKEELLAFMEHHKFERLADFKGHSLQYFTTHADLVRRQAEARAAKKAEARQEGDPRRRGVGRRGFCGPERRAGSGVMSH